MGVIEKILEEIEEGAHTFEILGRDVDFVAIDWVRDVIRKRLNDAEYPYITEKDIEAAPPANEEFLAECREVAKKYGKNDGWIPVEKQKPKRPVWKKGRSVICKDYADGHGKVEENKWADWVCPNCGWFVGEQYIPRRHNQQKSNYCSRCGQAIQWENLEGMEDG